MEKEIRDRLNNPLAFKDRVPKKIETMQKEMDSIYEYMCMKSGDEKWYINVGVTFSTSDIDKAKNLIEQITDLIEQAGVMNYVSAADSGRLYIVRSPKLVSGGQNGKHL